MSVTLLLAAFQNCSPPPLDGQSESSVLNLDNIDDAYAFKSNYTSPNTFSIEPVGDNILSVEYYIDDEVVPVFTNRAVPFIFNLETSTLNIGTHKVSGILVVSFMGSPVIVRKSVSFEVIEGGGL